MRTKAAFLGRWSAVLPGRCAPTPQVSVRRPPAILAELADPDPSSRVPRVLLIDDDIAEIAAVRRVLARAGLEVALATNATDAAAELGRAPPDLVLLAPACENGEVAAVARQIAEGDRSVPLLALGDDDASVPALRRLARPIDAAELEEAVREALGGATSTSTSPEMHLPPPADPWPHSCGGRLAASPRGQAQGRETATAPQEAARSMSGERDRVDFQPGMRRASDPLPDPPPSRGRETEVPATGDSVEVAVAIGSPSRRASGERGRSAPQERPRLKRVAPEDGASELRALLQAEAKRAEEVALQLGLLSRGQQRQVAPEAAALAVKMRAARCRAGPSPIDPARVDEKLSQVQRADYFVILGVPRDATPNTIDAAAERLLSELAPERFGEIYPGGMAGKLSEIRSVVGEARDVLMDDELRAEYLAGLAR